MASHSKTEYLKLDSDEIVASELFSVLEKKRLAACVFIEDEDGRVKDAIDAYKRKLKLRNTLLLKDSGKYEFLDGEILMRECRKYNQGSTQHCEYLDRVRNVISNVETLYLINYHVLSECNTVTEALTKRFEKTAKGEAFETVIESKEPINDVPTFSIFESVFSGLKEKMLTQLMVQPNSVEDRVDATKRRVKLRVVNKMTIDQKELDRDEFVTASEFLERLKRVREASKNGSRERKFRKLTIDALKSGDGKRVDALREAVNKSLDTLLS